MWKSGGMGVLKGKARQGYINVEVRGGVLKGKARQGYINVEVRGGGGCPEGKGKTRI